MTTENKTKLTLQGLTPYGTREEQNRIFDTPKVGQVASAAATVAQAETFMLEAVAKRPCRLRAANIVGDTGANPDNTSFASINIFKRTVTTPGTAVTMLTASTKTTASGGTGTITAWASMSLAAFMSGTDANLQLDTGDVVTFSVTKTAGGVALGTLQLTAQFEELSS